MQSETRINALGPYFGSLPDDLLRYIFLKLPLKESLRIPLICKYLCTKYDRDAEMTLRLDNMHTEDFTYIMRLTNLGTNWAVVEEKTKGKVLFQIILKVKCSSHYLWRNPEDNIEEAIKQFRFFLESYRLFELNSKIPEAANLREAGKAVAQKWVKKFDLPNQDWIENPMSATILSIFRTAWQHSENPMYGTYVGIAQKWRDSITKVLHERAPHCPLASLSLGLAYQNGRGEAKDQVQATYWFRHAAEQGNANAQYDLALQYYWGSGVQKNIAETVRLVQLAMQQGHLRAQVLLGQLYLRGEGVAKDETAALRLFNDAARKDNPSGQLNLGLNYLEGKGVQKNFTEALYWIWLAANQKFPEAQFELGLRYENGEGVQKDLKEAERLYLLAAREQFVKAQMHLGLIYFRDKKYREAFDFFNKASLNASTDATVCLAYMHLYGFGTEKSLPKALTLYKAAAEKGNTIAKLSLGILLPPIPEANRLFCEGEKALTLEEYKMLLSDPSDLAKAICTRLKKFAPAPSATRVTSLTQFIFKLYFDPC